MDPSKIARPGLVSKPHAPDASQPHGPTGTNASFTTPTGQTGAMELLMALEELVMASEADAGAPGPDDGDDEPVGWQGGNGSDGVDEQAKPMALTFGMLRRARTAIANFRALRAVLPALSPLAIGDGEMREQLANTIKSFVPAWWAAIHPNADRQFIDLEIVVAFGHRIAERALHTDEKKGGMRHALT